MRTAESRSPRNPLGRVYRDVDSLLELFPQRRDEIRTRLDEFRGVGQESDKRIFEELCFCLLTPQSGAKVCDAALRNLMAGGLLLTGTREEIASNLRGVRFHNVKAKSIVAAREEFYRGGQWSVKRRLGEFKDSFEAREWLAKNVLGLGYKEAGHFLRNIGRGDQLAILDRHILKNLQRHGVLKEVPKSLSRKEYLRIEALMREFADRTGVTLAELDLLFWSRETGEVFK